MAGRGENGNLDAGAHGSGDLISFVASRLGDGVARKIEEAFGGRQAYLPMTPAPHNVFTKVVGLENAKIIALEFGCGSVMVPLGDRRRRTVLIEAACLGDRSAGDIAKSFRCSTRWVHMKRADLRRQGKLR
jgi:hypothetical protein